MTDTVDDGVAVVDLTPDLDGTPAATLVVAVLVVVMPIATKCNCSWGCSVERHCTHCSSALEVDAGAGAGAGVSADICGAADDSIDEVDGVGVGAVEGGGWNGHRAPSHTTTTSVVAAKLCMAACRIKIYNINNEK